MRACEFINEAQITGKGDYTRPEVYRLIRILPNLNELVAGKDGSVWTVRNKRHRQTIHFTINGPVKDHTSGGWNKAPIAIIADPKEMGAPGSASFQDVWYYTDKSNRLNLGHPVILAPSGTTAPPGIKLTYYSGSRDEAIEQELEKYGIQMLGIGAHGANFGEKPYGLGAHNSKEEIAAFKSTYGFDPEIPSGSHFYSIDTSLEYALREQEAILKFIKSNGVEVRGLPQETHIDFSKNDLPGAAANAIKLADQRINSFNEMIANKHDSYSPIRDPNRIQHIQKIIKILQAYKRLFQRIAATPAN